MDFAELRAFLIVFTIFLIIGVATMVGIFVVLLMTRDERGTNDNENTTTIDYSKSEAYKVMCVKCIVSSSKRWFTVGKEYTVRRGWSMKDGILKDDQGFNWTVFDYMVGDKEIVLNGYLFYKLD